jgi:hypothetical protein
MINPKLDLVQIMLIKIARSDPDHKYAYISSNNEKNRLFMQECVEHGIENVDIVSRDDSKKLQGQNKEYKYYTERAAYNPPKTEWKIPR